MKITLKNCLDNSNCQDIPPNINTKQFLRYWGTIYDYLCENGMTDTQDTSIESIIDFLENNLKKDGK